MELSLRANFSWTFVGNAVYAACQWGMIAFLTKLGSPEMVGQFALGLALTAPIILFSNLQLRNIQATDAKREFAFGHYLGLRLTTIPLALLIISLVALTGGYQAETGLVIFLLGLAKSFEAISDVFYGLLQQHERMDRIAVSLMLKGLVSLVVLSAGVYFSGSLIWGLVGMIIAWASVLIFYDYRNGKRIVESDFPTTLSLVLPEENIREIRPRWEWSILRKLTKDALPLGVATMLISLNSNIPRYLIEHYWSERELGIFAALAYFMVVGGTVVGALSQSASPRLAKQYANDRLSEFVSLLLKLIGIGVIVGVVSILLAVVIGEELLTLVYQPEYARQDIFIFIMIAAGVGYVASFLGYGMTAVRYFRSQLPLFAFVTIATTLIGFWLIPQLGLRGAALTLIASASIQVILSSLVLWHALHTKSINMRGENVAKT